MTVSYFSQKNGIKHNYNILFLMWCKLQRTLSVQQYTTFVVGMFKVVLLSFSQVSFGSNSPQGDLQMSPHVQP